jgi:uncharacterized protein
VIYYYLEDDNMNRVINCAACGSFFEAIGFQNVCSNCIEQDKKDFDRIRDYLYIHPRAKIFEVANNLDILVPKIKRYLKDGRLEIIEKNNLFLKCEKCGQPICSGVQCNDCLKQASHDYKSSYAVSDTTKKQARVSYLSLKKK